MLPGLLNAPLLPIVLLGAAGLAWGRSALRNRALVRQAKDLSEEIGHLRADMARLEESTSRDRLTGAWNRRRFEEAAAMEMGLAHRRRAPLALISLDLDHFKRINDTYGHRAGDAVLAGAVAVFRTELRASDALVRWGGEEFLVLAPATGLDGAVNLAERLRLALEGAAFPGAEPMTLSAGVAEHLAHEPLDAWIARADGALYRAKTQGRNRVAGDHARSPHSDAAGGGLLELIWEDGYGSGHRLIDEQHVLLFDLSNALFSALVEGLPVSVAEARLDTLLYHAERHFHDEEGLLRKAGYPDLDQHRGEHARLLGAARSLQAEMRAGSVDFGRLVTYLTTDLVKGHLLTEDRHYFDHLNHRLGRESPA